MTELVVKNEDDRCMKCGKESTKGCHGIKDAEIYSEYYCDECFSHRNYVKETGNEKEIPHAL